MIIDFTIPDIFDNPISIFFIIIFGFLFAIYIYLYCIKIIKNIGLATIYTKDDYKYDECMLMDVFIIPCFTIIYFIALYKCVIYILVFYNLIESGGLLPWLLH